jgi:hypothetical protein
MIHSCMRIMGDRSNCGWGEFLASLQMKCGTENGDAWAKGSWMWLHRRYGLSSSLVRLPSDPSWIAFYLNIIQWVAKCWDEVLFVQAQ